MGLVTVQIRGSFGGTPKQGVFSATEGGHAVALARAIAYLTAELPRAIVLDHDLERAGEKPPAGDFGKFPGSLT